MEKKHQDKKTIDSVPEIALNSRRAELNIELAKLLLSAHRKEIKIDPAAKLSTYGIDSICAMEFIGLVEEKYNTVLPEALVWKNPTMEQIAEYVAKTEK